MENFTLKVKNIIFLLPAGKCYKCWPQSKADYQRVIYICKSVCSGKRKGFSKIFPDFLPWINQFMNRGLLSHLEQYWSGTLNFWQSWRQNDSEAEKEIITSPCVFLRETGFVDEKSWSAVYFVNPQRFNFTFLFHCHVMWTCSGSYQHGSVVKPLLLLQNRCDTQH